MDNNKLEIRTTQLLQYYTEEAKENLKMNRIMLNIKQNEKLKDLLFYAKEKSSWYKDKLKNIDIDRVTIENMHQFIPITNKKEFTENWDAFCTDKDLSKKEIDTYLKLVNSKEDRQKFNMYRDKYHVISSSGSSGRPGIYVYTEEEWLKYCAQFSRLFDKNMKHLKIANLTVKSMLFASPRSSKTLLTGHREYDLNEEYFGDVRKINERLTALNPDIIITLPSILRKLIREKELGNVDINPIYINTSAEPLTRDLKEKAVKVFDNPMITNIYAGSEGFAAFTCAANPNKLHLAEDCCIFESSEGMLTITNLWLKTTPLIRYQLDDRIEIQSNGYCKKCVCCFRVIDEPQGRASEEFIYDNIVITTLELTDEMNYYPCINEFQIEQTLNGMCIKIVGGNISDGDKIKKAMERNLRSKGIMDPIIKIRHVDTIERSGSGKLKQFVSLKKK